MTTAARTDVTLDAFIRANRDEIILPVPGRSRQSAGLERLRLRCELGEDHAVLHCSLSMTSNKRLASARCAVCAELHVSPIDGDPSTRVRVERKPSDRAATKRTPPRRIH